MTLHEKRYNHPLKRPCRSIRQLMRKLQPQSLRFHKRGTIIKIERQTKINSEKQEKENHGKKIIAEIAEEKKSEPDFFDFLC